MSDLSGLLKSASMGDERAFESFVKETETAVYRYLYAMVRSREDALDLSQETYLRLWRTLPSYRHDCAPTTWLFRIAKSCALDLLRKKGKETALPLHYSDEGGEQKNTDLPDPSIDANPEEAFTRKATQEAVREAILALGEDQQSVLLLREFEGLSYEEIASRLSLELGTVKSRLSRARNSVKEFLISRNFLH